MTKFAMVSQPMNGKTVEEITNTRERAISILHQKGYEIVNTLFDFTNEELDEAIVNKPLYFLGKSIEHMARTHAVYFCKGWEKTRGCIIEHEAAKAYNLEILYEE